MKKKKQKNNIVVFQSKSGAIELRGDFEKDTVWATQSQIAEVFGVNVRTISEHLGNIFKNKELSKNSVIRNFRNTATDGKTYKTQFYNLDAIISVGYRVDSKTANLGQNTSQHGRCFVGVKYTKFVAFCMSKLSTLMFDFFTFGYIIEV